MSLVNPLSRNVPQCALLFFTFLTPDTGAKLTPFNSGGGGVYQNCPAKAHRLYLFLATISPKNVGERGGRS